MYVSQAGEKKFTKRTLSSRMLTFACYFLTMRSVCVSENEEMITKVCLTAKKYACLCVGMRVFTDFRSFVQSTFVWRLLGIP